ncbi:transcription factor HES-4 [Ixodes scapularis]|uniref:transcription factor HES-4 n=1 Tax=Ixodes scapularis TaxID=6945 RepID=UPI0011619969|nr:transcription factor HES-4 [Ixodes scapularis]
MTTTPSRLTPPPPPPVLGGQLPPPLALASLPGRFGMAGLGAPTTSGPGPIIGSANGPTPSAERPPTQSRASEVRRATKPIMEKRRRARINQCLTELKALILDALNKDPSRHSKLEKADILEMTVRHLQNVQRQQMTAALATDPAVMGKFRAGFAECATEVSRYVTRLESVEPHLRQRLVGHLSTCVSGLSGSGPASPLGAGSGLLISPLSVQIPGLGDVNNNNNGNSGHNGAGRAGSAPGRLQLGGLPLIPSRLPNGDLAFVLPTVSAVGTSWGPPTPTNTSTPTSPHPPRTPSPASSFGSALSPGGSDAGSDLSSEPQSSSAGCAPMELPQRPFREVMHEFQLQQRQQQQQQQQYHLQLQQQHEGEPQERGDDSVWRPW